MILSRIVERSFRSDGPRVRAALIRLTGDFDAAEDALQEAYARAIDSWRDALPDRPGAWIHTVARRLAIDRLRRHRDRPLPDDLAAPAVALAADPHSDIDDDRLRLLFVCCHPALPFDARAALALRTLGGLTTPEIARAFVEAEAATAQRIVRAKRKIREARIPFEVPPPAKLAERTQAVLAVLYLIFNEGHTATAAPTLMRPDLVVEAIRLARLTVDLLRSSAEAQGLLALMLLTDARRGARLTPDGDLVPLEQQDRRLWDSRQIEEGTRLIDAALTRRQPGPYQVQAAIAAVHDTAPSAADTDWPQIAALYDTLLAWSPTPVIELNAAVAHAMAGRLERAVRWIERIEAGGTLAAYHHLFASKADVLRRLGRHDEAADAYRRALALTANPAERRFLESRLTESSAPAR